MNNKITDWDKRFVLHGFSFIVSDLEISSSDLADTSGFVPSLEDSPPK